MFMPPSNKCVYQGGGGGGECSNPSFQNPHTYKTVSVTNNGKTTFYIGLLGPSWIGEEEFRWEKGGRGEGVRGMFIKNID